MAVVIETTIGDITVDLYTEERPQTCKNFLKLCKLKYYNFSLFHTVQSNFIAQTGDPSGSGTGGESVFGIVYGPESRYYEGEKMPKIKHTKPGLLSMVNCGSNMLGSQFFVTLGSELQSLDEHCIFAEVTEGLDVLFKLNEAICDFQHRPYQDIRITHTVILEDPFDDLPGMLVPPSSPDVSLLPPSNGRLGADEVVGEDGLTGVEMEEAKADQEARARATILEIVGDLPHAEVAPPENVLFVCKLNPVTGDDDLELIFSRFGKINSCEVIRDHLTGDSLQYAFIEFDDKKSCEQAYMKMDNVLIDDRRIHVDFSQSVSEIRWNGKGRGVQYINKGDPKYHPTRSSSNHRREHHNRERDRGDRDKDRRREDDRRRREREREEEEGRRRRRDEDGNSRYEDKRREERRREEERKKREEKRREETRREERHGRDGRRRDDRKVERRRREEEESPGRAKRREEEEEQRARKEEQQRREVVPEVQVVPSSQHLPPPASPPALQPTEPTDQQASDEPKQDSPTPPADDPPTKHPSDQHPPDPHTPTHDKKTKKPYRERRKRRETSSSSSSGSSRSSSSSSDSSSTSSSSSSSSSATEKIVIKKNGKSKKKILTKKYYDRKGKLVKVVRKARRDSSSSISSSDLSDIDKKRRKRKHKKKKKAKVIKKRGKKDSDDEDDSEDIDSDDTRSNKGRIESKHSRKRKLQESKKRKKKHSESSEEESYSPEKKKKSTPSLKSESLK